jgi:hypothetical protein
VPNRHTPVKTEDDFEVLKRWEKAPAQRLDNRMFVGDCATAATASIVGAAMVRFEARTGRMLGPTRMPGHTFRSTPGKAPESSPRAKRMSTSTRRWSGLCRRHRRVGIPERRQGIFASGWKCQDRTVSLCRARMAGWPCSTRPQPFLRACTHRMVWTRIKLVSVVEKDGKLTASA